MTKFKIGDKVKVRIDLMPYKVYGGLTFLNNHMSKCAGQICTIKEITINNRYRVNENLFVWSEEMLEPVAPTLDVPTSEWCNPMQLNDLIVSRTETERATDAFLKALEKTGVKFGIKNLEQELKEEKKMATKFTFYVTEGTRPDKNPDGDGKGVIPTMTTTVANGFDEVSVTCDKADYSERQGVLEAIAQLYCKGRFDKEYEAAVKINKREDKANRTCYYCGKIFDTVEERAEHEAWHVERRKARHERYLLRKRAKEIAFEEQAQKMAKEMMKEDK